MKVFTIEELLTVTWTLTEDIFKELKDADYLFGADDFSIKIEIAYAIMERFKKGFEIQR
jgi:hypothetical protein